MAEIYIHIPGGEQLSIVPEASSSQDWALMGDNKLSLSFQRYECSILPAGAWCEFDGVIFYLLQEYKPTMIHSHLWQYNVAFVDGASWLGVTTALKTIDGEDAPLFTLTAPAAEHAAIIVSNVNRRLGTTVWEVGSVIDTPNITIEYTGKYCGAVLQEIVDGQNTEWWVDGTTLNIGRAEFGSLIELGYRDGLLGDITVTQADNMSSYRTLYPVGSTRNILPTEYGHDRLQLPNGQKSVMMNPAGVAELVEEAAFAGIYPRYKGKVTGVSTSIGQSNDGSQYLIYIVADTAIPFNPNEYEMPGLVKHITFQSGELMGAEFEVNYNPASKEFELITQFQENGSQLPGGMLIPQVGDEYVVWNISMPAEYYPLAEQELLEAAESFAAASTRESNVYKVKLDYIDVQERGLSLRPGQKVRLHSVDYFPEQGYYDSRITRVTRPVNYPGEYTIDVSAVRVVGSLTRLQASLAAAATKVNSLSNTVQTVVQTVSNAVTLTGNQRVKGVKDFVDGIRINGSPVIEYDPVINTWLFRGNILAEGGMAAFSNIKGFTPSTITDAVLIDNRTIKRGADGLMYVDLNEVGGGGSGGGSVDPSQLEAYLKPYAKTADVASTYATIASLSAVTSRLNDFLAGSDTDAIINKWSELETFLAGLAETDNLATILSGKANKATTLAGYGITDAYTKSHIDSNFVTIGTKQEITGEKDFVGGFKVNGGLVEYNATLKAWVFNGDLLVTGGVSAFSNISGFKPSTITEAVLIDNRTIKRNADGLLYAVAQETDGINEEQLADYLTTNGYATQSWVTGRGYITSSALNAYLPKTGGQVEGDLTIKGSRLQPLYIQSGQSSAGIIFFTATENATLMYSGGSNWRVTDNEWKQAYYLLHSGNYREYITKSYVKNTLGISDWALASAKPSYSYSEISGTPTSLKNPTALSWSGYSSGSYDGSTAQSIALPTKLSQLTDDMVSGKYLSLAGGTISQSGYWGAKFKSTGQTSSGIAFEVANGNVGYLMYGDGSKWQVTAQNWSATHTLLHSGNYSDYALPLTGGTVNGQVTSEGVDNFVAKGSAYSLYFGIGAGQVNRGIYDLTLNKWWIVRGADATTTINASIIAEGLRINQTDFDNGLILNRTAANLGVGIVAMSNGVRLGTFGINGTKTFEIAGDNGIVAQVSTVTGEATFNGMTTIKHSGNTPLVINQTYATNNSRGVVLMNGSMANGHIYYSHLFGKAASSKNSAYIGFYHASAGSDSNYLSMGLYGVNNVLNITAAGNVGIGTTSPSEKLHVYGNILATGGVTAQNSSDRRLKKNIRKFNASKTLMSLGAVWEYEYIDSEVQKNPIYEGTHYGLIYQHVKGTTLDVMCHEREDGFGTLNYIHPKFISLIAGATMENISEIEKLKRENRRLKKRVEQLEKRVA